MSRVSQSAEVEAGAVEVSAVRPGAARAIGGAWAAQLLAGAGAVTVLASAAGFIGVTGMALPIVPFLALQHLQGNTSGGLRALQSFLFQLALEHLRRISASGFTSLARQLRLS